MSINDRYVVVWNDGRDVTHRREYDFTPLTKENARMRMIAHLHSLAGTRGATKVGAFLIRVERQEWAETVLRQDQRG